MNERGWRFFSKGGTGISAEKNGAGEEFGGVRLHKIESEVFVFILKDLGNISFELNHAMMLG